MSKPPETLRHVPDSMIAACIFVACLLLYLPTLSPSVVAGDGGELQMISQVLGVAHPSGYPLLTLLGWLAGRLPIGGDAAWRVTLLCMTITAATVALLYLLVRELGASITTALIGALLTASTTSIWSYAAATEAVALSNFFIVLVWLLLIRWAKGTAPLSVVALAFGLGLTHHITMRLLAPAALVFVLAIQPRLALYPRRWLLALPCLLIPLILYAYIPLRATHFERLPELNGEILGVRKAVASGFVTPHYYAGGTAGLILAMDYSRHALGGNATANWPGAMRQYIEMTGQQFGVVFIVIPLAVVGILTLLRRDRKASLLFLLSLSFILFPALAETAIWYPCLACGKHFIPTYLVIIIWFVLGAETILTWGTHGCQRWPFYRLILIAILAAPLAVNVTINFPRAMNSRYVDNSRAILSQPLPEGAVVTGEWAVVTPLRYHQRVEGLRPDLWIIHTDAPGTSILMQRALAQGIPFYTLRSTASGTRLLALPLRHELAIANPTDMMLGQIVRWRGYDLHPITAAPGEELQITLYWQPITTIDRAWKTFIHLLDERGEKVAQVDRVPLADYYPPTTWQPNLLLADPYELPLPANLPPGRYRLIFGWYEGAERLGWADGQSARLLADIDIGP